MFKSCFRGILSISLLSLFIPSVVLGNQVHTVVFVTVIQPSSPAAAPSSPSTGGGGGGGGASIQPERVSPEFITFNSSTSPELISVQKITETSAEICWRANEIVWGVIKIGRSANVLDYSAQTLTYAEAHCTTVPIKINQTDLYFEIKIYDRHGNWSVLSQTRLFSSLSFFEPTKTNNKITVTTTIPEFLKTVPASPFLEPNILKSEPLNNSPDIMIVDTSISNNSISPSLNKSFDLVPLQNVFLARLFWIQPKNTPFFTPSVWQKILFLIKENIIAAITD